MALGVRERGPASQAIVPARNRVERIPAARVPAADVRLPAMSATFWECSGPCAPGSMPIDPAEAEVGPALVVPAMAAWSTIVRAFAPVI